MWKYLVGGIYQGRDVKLKLVKISVHGLLKQYVWEWGISTTGLKKQSVVRFFTMWTIFQLNSRQSVKQTAEEAKAKDKKEGYNGEKEEEELRTGWEGQRSGEANELNGWTFWQLPIKSKHLKKKMKIIA